MKTKYMLQLSMITLALSAMIHSCTQPAQNTVKTDLRKEDVGEVSDHKMVSNSLNKDIDQTIGLTPTPELKEESEKQLEQIKETPAWNEPLLEKKSISDKPASMISADETVVSPSTCMATGAPAYSWTPESGVVSTPTVTTTYALDYSLPTGSGSAIKTTHAGGSAETMDMEMPVAEYSMDSYSGGSTVSPALAGKLTAGEINDFKKWKMWEDYSEPQLTAYKSVWDISPNERFSVLVQTESGAPIVDCVTELIAKSGETMWQTRTDNTGKAELWGSFKNENSKLVADKIVVYHHGKSFKIEHPKPFHKSINSIKIPATCSIPDEVDICFTVDATGSMGDEINYLQAELLDVIGKIKSNHKEIDLNLGSVFYRDFGDTYLTRFSPFSKDPEQTNKFIADQYADGGGDGPEAVDEAMRTSLFEMDWSDEARARIMFLILDAPPHQSKENQILLDNCIREAAKKGVRIVPLVASGGGYEMDKSMEYLMRCSALATNGTYAFLTNHSGIGGEHTAPSTDHYEVETLNALLLRIVGEYLTIPDCNLQTFVLNEAPLDTVNVTAIPDPLPIDSLDTQIDTTNTHIEPNPQEVIVISCYPNPASDYIWVKTSDDVSELFLTDNSGKIMQRITPLSRLFELDLSYYPSGIYYIKALINEKWVTARIIVARMK